MPLALSPSISIRVVNAGAGALAGVVEEAAVGDAGAGVVAVGERDAGLAADALGRAGEGEEGVGAVDHVILRKLAHQLHAGHARHRDVQEEDVRGDLRCERERAPHWAMSRPTARESRAWARTDPG